jgi:hypothetical protein
MIFEEGRSLRVAQRECPMTRAYICRLSKDEQQALLDDLNYLNLSEIKSFCKRHSIPFKIAVKTGDGRTLITNEDDRKGVILNKIRRFLKTGDLPERTCFPAEVTCLASLRDNLVSSDRLYYGQYDKTNRAMNVLLKSLTAGQFKNGAVARMLAREFWSHGKAPTFAEYAAAWIESSKRHTGPNPEWAFLADRVKSGNVRNWKQLRAQKASRVLKTLDRLISASKK